MSSSPLRGLRRAPLAPQLLPPLLLCAAVSVCLGGVIPEQKHGGEKEGHNDVLVLPMDGIVMAMRTPNGAFLSEHVVELDGGAQGQRLLEQPLVGSPLGSPLGVPAAGAQPALERGSVLAGASEVGPQPALDAPAALLRDGQPAASERLGGMVADDAVVMTRDGFPPQQGKGAAAENNKETGKPAGENTAQSSEQEKDRKRKVSNITPKNKPTWSESLLPGVVQVLIHLMDSVEYKELSKLQLSSNDSSTSATELPGVEATTPMPASTAPNESNVPVLTIVIPASSSVNGSSSAPLIFELVPNKPASQDPATQELHSESEDAVEGAAVVQKDVPVVNEETVPMMIDMVPSDTPEMMVQADAPELVEVDDSNTAVEASAAAPPNTETTANPDVLKPEKYVYYPTLYFSDEWGKNPDSDVGFLGYREPGEQDKDHVDDAADSQDDEGRVSLEDIIDSPDFAQKKDDGFLLSLVTETRIDSTQAILKGFKPSKELLKLAKLRFSLSSEAKRLNYKKFQGYSAEVVTLLTQTSSLTGREQLGVLLAEVISRGEIQSQKTLRLAKATLLDLEAADSALSAALEGVPALKYATD